MARCYMCKKNVESVDHLLLHCKVARALLDDMFSRTKLAWVMPRSLVDLRTCWNGLQGSPYVAAVWRMIPSYLVWCI